MARHFTRRRTLVLLAVAIAAIAAPLGAYAYFSATGTGSGSATVGSSSTIELSSAAGDVTGTLYPGGADVPVVVHIKNPGSGAQYVGTVSGTVEDSGQCLGSWFVVDSKAVDADLAKGASTTASTVMRMIDANANQDACQGKTLTIDWTSTAS